MMMMVKTENLKHALVSNATSKIKQLRILEYIILGFKSRVKKMARFRLSKKNRFLSKVKVIKIQMRQKIEIKKSLVEKYLHNANLQIIESI